MRSHCYPEIRRDNTPVSEYPAISARLVLSSFLLSSGLLKRDGKEAVMMMETREPPATPVRHDGAELEELTNGMVRLYKELFGRGPTKARTDYAGPNTIVATIEDSLTRAEQTMVGLGEHRRVRAIRMFFQYASERDFVGVVESTTGRKVRAFVSGIDTEKDVSSEVFYLEPLTGVNGRPASGRFSPPAQ